MLPYFVPATDATASPTPSEMSPEYGASTPPAGSTRRRLASAVVVSVSDQTSLSLTKPVALKPRSTTPCTIVAPQTPPQCLHDKTQTFQRQAQPNGQGAPNQKIYVRQNNRPRVSLVDVLADDVLRIARE